MSFLFRADASLKIGSGHIMRCRTLAFELRRRGESVHFVCRSHDGHLAEFLQRDGFAVSLLPSPQMEAAEDDFYASWLGVEQLTDAEQTVSVIEEVRPRTVIVDHYGLDRKWEHAVGQHVSEVFVIDDLANRWHDCSRLLDQSYADDNAYKELLVHETECYFGPRFSLLGPQYAALQALGRHVAPSVERILVFFGGVDAGNATGLALKALSAAEFANIHVDVVLGLSNPHTEKLIRLYGDCPNISLLGALPQLADVMADADIFIGAGGLTTWERICLGLPSIVVSVAENQLRSAEALHRDGYLIHLGLLPAVSAADIKAATLELCGNAEKRTAISEQGMALVDGLGTLRIAELLSATPSEELTLRRATLKDARLYYDWANDPIVRAQSLRTEKIVWSGHLNWFMAKLRDESSHLFVVMAGDLPVGQIRFDVADGIAEIGYSLDQIARRRGWARRLVEMGMHSMINEGVANFKAVVKIGNPASAAVFRRLGFREKVSLNTHLFDGTFTFSAAGGSSQSREDEGKGVRPLDPK